MENLFQYLLYIFIRYNIIYINLNKLRHRYIIKFNLLFRLCIQISVLLWHTTDPTQSKYGYRRLTREIRVDCAVHSMMTPQMNLGSAMVQWYMASFNHSYYIIINYKCSRFVLFWRAPFQKGLGPFLMKIELSISLDRIPFELFTQWISARDNQCKLKNCKFKFVFPIEACTNLVKETRFSPKLQKWT